MRRSTRVGLAVLILVVVLIGAYSGYWYMTARQLEGGLAQWAQAIRARQIEAHWRRSHIGGYPLRFRIEVRDAAIADKALTPAPRLSLPVLVASARPWKPTDWRLAAAEGATGDYAGIAGKEPVSLKVRQAAGRITAAADGGSTFSFDLQDLKLVAAAPVAARSARLQITFPPRPAQTYSEPDVSFSVSLQGTKLPVAIAPLGATIADLDFSAAIKGPVPEGKLPEVAAKWRDAGGTIELETFHFRWGGLEANATGTLALDRQLQPVGGFSGEIEGYDQIITALVAQGMLPADKAGLARLVLTMLAKAGPDGRPEIATSFTIQNGRMFLGPAPIGKAPHIDWR